MKTKFRETLARANEVAFRYPIVLIMALITVIAVICAFENRREAETLYTFSIFAMVCGLGISLMFALKMLSQRIGKSIIPEAIGIVFLIAFYFIFPKKEKDFTEIYGYTIAITALLTHLLVSFIPFLYKNKELNFWQYNKNLFVNIFLTAIFTGVLTLGVELAILAIDKLFYFDFGDRVYAETFYVFAIFGSCFIFLLFNEKGLNTLEKDGNYPVVLKFFTQFILIPLLLIYGAILYFYSIKILINWELPRGWVSYLVLAYSVVGILALLLVHPLKEETAKSWVKIFSKAFYFTIIPLIILLFTAIFTRILEYGYTEPRYFVLLLALWLLSIVIYFIFNKKASIKFIPISLFVFGVFTLIFPYLNAFSVAKRSQKAELLDILNENKLLKNGKINFEKKIVDTISVEIADKFAFLAERKEVDFLSQFLDNKEKDQLKKNIKDSGFYVIRYQIQDKFNNVYKTANVSENQRLVITSEKKAIEIGNYQYLLDFSRFEQEPKEINEDTFKLEDKVNEKLSLKIILNDKENADFSNSIRQLIKQNKGKTGEINVPEIAMESDLGKYHIKLIFKEITLEKFTYEKEENIYFEKIYVLVKNKTSH